MKKYIMGAVVISLLCMSQVGMAMKKEVKTSLSPSEVAELRQAVINYKKNKSRLTQEKIINKYAKKYPNDPFVKSKLNEKARVDGTFVQQSKKQVTKPMQPIGEPNLRLFNNTADTIRLEFAYLVHQYFHGGSEQVSMPDPSLTVIIKPYETGQVRVNDENGLSIEITVSYSRKTGFVYAGTAGTGIVKSLSKGQIVDMTFGDDGAYFDTRAGKTVPHVYETDRK